MFALALILSLPSVLGDSTTLLKPIKDGPHAGLVLVQGAQIKTGAYAPLAAAIQAASPFALYVAIPAYIGDVPEPLQLGSGVDTAKKAMYAAGLNESAPLAMAGHSLGGAMLQDYVFSCKDCVAQVLMGAGLLRKYRNGTKSKIYPVPTLTLDGDLDGLMRVTRQAENYYFLQHSEDPHEASRFPVVIHPGISHMQFASGTPPSNVKKNDLKPEVSDDAAHATIARTVSNFLNMHLPGVGSSTAATSTKQMSDEVSATAPIMAPIISSLEMEGYKHFKSPCNSDYPMPSCPLYPRFPSGQKGNTPQIDCTCGTPWSAKAQQILAGVDEDVTFDVNDAVHSVSDINPIHLPHIWSKTCGSEKLACEVNSTTVTQPIYSTLDALDTGFYYTSSSELRTKLKSRQSMYIAVGRSDVNFTATDVVPSLCKAVNQASYDLALSMAGPRQLARYKRIGQPLVMGDDIFLGNAGPLWIDNPLKYNTASDNSHVTVQAPCSHTPVDYAISSAAGFHYCKVLSPARALEWIYIDGLRAHGGL